MKRTKVIYMLNEQYGKFTISIGLMKISGSCHFTEFYERADMLLYS